MKKVDTDAKCGNGCGGEGETAKSGCGMCSRTLQKSAARKPLKDSSVTSQNSGQEEIAASPAIGADAVFVSVPLRTGRGQNDREHWRVKARRVKSERQSIAWALMTQKRPAPPCVVTITRIAPSNGLDGDNLQGACKALRDGVADWLGIDDADARVQWRYEQRRGKEYAVEVRIE